MLQDNKELEIFDTEFFNNHFNEKLMQEFDMQMQSLNENTYSLFDANHAGFLQISKSNTSPLKAFISLNAGKKSNNDGSPFFNENNTFLLQIDGVTESASISSLNEIINNINNMQHNRWYNVIFTDSHEVDIIFYKDAYGSISMIIIDSNGMCVDPSSAQNFIKTIKDCVNITHTVVIGTNGIGNGSGYCYPFAQNMLYTLEKNDATLLRQLINFTKPYNLLTPCYRTASPGTMIGDYFKKYKNSTNMFDKPTFIRCIDDSITQTQDFMREILLNTVQYRSGPYLSKYINKDEEEKDTNIYLHFSTLAQVLSDPFLLANILDGNPDFSLQHDDVKKILSIADKYMPNLHKKIKKSIDSQKYIIDFMRAYKYNADTSVNGFLAWLSNEYKNITHQILKQAFDEYIKDTEKTKQSQHKVNNIHMQMNEVYTNKSIQQPPNDQHSNIMINDGINSQLQVDTSKTNPHSVQLSLCGYNNKYIGWDDDGCHCFDWW